MGQVQQKTSQESLKNSNCLSAKIAHMLQSTFFNAHSKINQGTIDLLEQFIDAAKIVKTPKFSNDTVIIMTSIATNLIESAIQSGDLIIYHDVIVPMVTDVALLLKLVEKKTQKISLLEI